MKNVKITFAFFLLINLAFSQAPAITIDLSGNGTPIIFLPGFTTPGSVWEETITHLEGNYQNHVVSYAGFDGNTPIAMPWYDTIKKELITYVKENKLTDVIIIGHSMGGNLAIDIAASLPNSIKDLILVDSIPCMRELMMPGVSETQIQYDSPYNKQMLSMNEEQFTQTALMMAQNMTNKKEKVNTLLDWIQTADRETYVYGYTDLLKLDLRKVLDRITAKTLIVGAAFPTIETAKANYEKQYAQLSNKRIEMIPDSKHFIMFDQPELLYEKINEFLTNE
ncbi:alpha/beta hydrolase [Aquimarina sp. MMG015]|uniref:alpha/beta fold hydrolase n=1 Tax=unclassified Aquimarina TaxID=2627091 RepID=UPI000E47B2DE|nr:MULTISPECIES: alpha/beta hydrolase [unclassified Aquimarina]AXT56059.1 alpha/beta hydrolase [Aquimarina sp. AD1]MBQ4803854.1 alpha/beta hydrolase [Aquimarina sp. MMG015]RKN27025.1 alpha/beta fold hydrolase [Aquimarina sp. AD1]